MQGETMFDNMENWTHEMSERSLKGVMTAVLTNQISDVNPRYESTVNQMLCFVVRDLERSRI